jgi:DNA-binding Lrp family transcriptional regulator
MAVEAFVLINVSGDHTKSAYKTITRIEGVKAVYAVTGVYDIIAHVESEDINNLSDLIISRIRGIDGVTRTMTCVSLNV